MKVGQIVYYTFYNDSWGIVGKVKETKVTKVGRKYFKIEDMPNIRFSITTMRDDTKYHKRFKIFLSLQSYNDEKEYDKLSYKLLKHWNKNPCFTKLSLSQLRRIVPILEESI